MAVWRVPEYKPWDIERIAQAFLAEHWSPSERYVDVEAIIERDLRILIDYTTVDALSTVGSIGRRPSDGRLVIVVDERMADGNPNRYRFTLAQELGHVLLHEDILESVQTTEDSLHLQETLTEGEYDRMERDANWCAGSLLMPQHPFAEAAFDAYAIWFRRMEERVGTILPDVLLKRVVDELAKLYQVSSQAARIRLQRYPIKLYDDILLSAKHRQPTVCRGWEPR